MYFCYICWPSTLLHMLAIHIVTYVGHPHCYICWPSILLHMLAIHTVTYVGHPHCYICWPSTLLHMLAIHIVMYVGHPHCYICWPSTLLHMLAIHTLLLILKFIFSSENLFHSCYQYTHTFMFLLTLRVPSLNLKISLNIAKQ